MILMVASTNDVAGMNIANTLVRNYRFERVSEISGNPSYLKKNGDCETKLTFVNEDLVHTQGITDSFAPELLIFLSRHSSATGTPTLSVHTPGNLTKDAKFGGAPRKVSVSPAGAMRKALLKMVEMKEEMGLDYNVSYECTHHGPSLDVPTMFVELGSSLKQWEDLKGAKVVADAAMAALSEETQYRTALGIGGSHYNRKFTRIGLTTSTAFGHIIPKYVVSQIDAEMIRQCIERTAETVELAVLEWKGIKGADRRRLITDLEGIGVPIEKV